MKHTDAKHWSEIWLAVVGDQEHEPTKETGQGKAFLVRRREDETGEILFLKALAKNDESESRSRMYKELAAYEILQHSGIPTPIESNCRHYEDAAYELYFVAERIHGPTLAQYIEKHGPLDFGPSVQLTIKLLEVVEYIHGQEFLHRDIKPENVMLRDGSIDKIVLVDFGIAYKSCEEGGHSTATIEQLGNRFLRLPELAPNSAAKRTQVSDLTFCAGILLFALTGRVPALLVDEAGLHPHQRASFRETIDAKAPADRRQLNRLLSWLDRSFNNNLAKRWPAASEMIGQLRKVMELGASDEAIFEKLKAYGESGEVAARSRQLLALNRLHSVLFKGWPKVVKECLGDAYIAHCEGKQVTSQPEISFGATVRLFGEAAADRVEFRLLVAGSEMVAVASWCGEFPIVRAVIDDPDWPQIHSDVNASLVALLRRYVSEVFGGLVS